MMTINEAHMRATAGDRILRVVNRCTGPWYTDHVLDFVAKHKDDRCRLILETSQIITVEMED